MDPQTERVNKKKFPFFFSELIEGFQFFLNHSAYSTRISTPITTRMKKKIQFSIRMKFQSNKHIQY